MRGLNIVLSVIYPILIILLLLMNLRSCEREEVRTRIVERVPVVVEPPVEVIDTVAAGRALEVGGSGPLKITLLWDFAADIDLHVIEPNGYEISFINTIDPSTGGKLNVDDMKGVGPDSDGENIFWENTPLSGEYKVSICYYGLSTYSLLAETGECTVVVFIYGEPKYTRKVEMTQVEETKEVIKFNFP